MKNKLALNILFLSFLLVMFPIVGMDTETMGDVREKKKLVLSVHLSEKPIVMIPTEDLLNSFPKLTKSGEQTIEILIPLNIFSDGNIIKQDIYLPSTLLCKNKYRIDKYLIMKDGKVYAQDTSHSFLYEPDEIFVRNLASKISQNC